MRLTRIVPKPNPARIVAEAFGSTWVEPAAPAAPAPSPRPPAIEAASGQCGGTTQAGRRCPFGARERLGPVALCRVHMDALLSVAVAADVAPQEVESVPASPATGSGVLSFVPPLSIVYYVGVRESRLVKIGTTGRPRVRLMTLQRRRPGLVLLAHERGGSDLERLRHDQFRHFRADFGVEREWFRRSDALMEHIAKVRAANPIIEVLRLLPASFPVAPVKRSAGGW